MDTIEFKTSVTQEKKKPTPEDRLAAIRVMEATLATPTDFHPDDLLVIQAGLCGGRYSGFLEVFKTRVTPEYRDLVASEYDRVMQSNPCKACSQAVQRRYA